MFDIGKVREDFPILKQKIGKKDLVFLDSAASSQKPSLVIDGLKEFYETSYANIHRGVYDLSQKASTAYEAVRGKVAKFINASCEDEIVFTRNTTESINLVATSWGRSFLKEGDEILVCEIEHHANIVPWHFLAKEKGIILKTIPVHDDGTINMEEYEKLLTPKVKLVSIAHVSNTLGLINPVKEMTAKARHIGAKVMIDGCQSIVHMSIDVQDIGCDFFAFSSHKMYGPTGVGGLYGRKKLLEEMPPYQGGGGMIENVCFNDISFSAPPARFEAGTVAIAETVGFGYAIDYVNGLGMTDIMEHETRLTEFCKEGLDSIKDLRVFGTGRGKTSIFSFEIKDIHPQDIAFILNKEGIAVRSGTHCAEPMHNRFRSQYGTSVRASLALYNTEDEIKTFIKAIDIVKNFFKRN